MGCIFFKSKKGQSDSKELIPEKKEYSWDKRPKVNLKDYTIENVIDSTSIKVPGTIDGKQFIIQNCKNAFIYILDHCSTVTIDDCSNCKIVIGPTKGSIFIRNCENCVLVTLCGQFRARDCRKVTVYLCCPSQPAIESCCKIRFGCCLLSYKGLKDQMTQANISQFNNQWNSVYDFTPLPSEGSNWRIVDYADEFSDVMNQVISNVEEFLNEVDFIVGDHKKSNVPLTTGTKLFVGSCEDSCLVIILSGPQQAQHALDFIEAMINMDGRFELVETRERSIGINEAKMFFSEILPISLLSSESQLHLVGLHFRGHGCVDKCQQVVAHHSLLPDWSGQVFSSPHSKISTQQIQHFMTAPEHC